MHYSTHNMDPSPHLKPSKERCVEGTRSLSSPSSITQDHGLAKWIQTLQQCNVEQDLPACEPVHCSLRRQAATTMQSQPFATVNLLTGHGPGASDGGGENGELAAELAQQVRVCTRCVCAGAQQH